MSNDIDRQALVKSFARTYDMPIEMVEQVASRTSDRLKAEEDFIIQLSTYLDGLQWPRRDAIGIAGR